MGFFGGVVELEREDREPVDDEAGGLGVKSRGGRLIASGMEKHAVERLDEIVAALVQGIDGVFHAGDVGVRRQRVAGLVFFMPKLEIGAVLGFDDLEEELGSCCRRGVFDGKRTEGADWNRGLRGGCSLMPAKGGVIVQAGYLSGVEHVIRGRPGECLGPHNCTSLGIGASGRGVWLS